MALLNSNKYWRIYFALICFISLHNCKQKSEQGHKFEITIDYGDSYKIDLVNKKYIVFFRGKPPVEINISLSIVEESRILEKYSDCELDKTPRVFQVQDYCSTMPKIFTVITSKSDDGVRKIQIDEQCDKYSSMEKIRALKIRAFLNLIKQIILEKKEVKAAPLSNIGYL